VRSDDKLQSFEKYRGHISNIETGFFKNKK